MTQKNKLVIIIIIVLLSPNFRS